LIPREQNKETDKLANYAYTKVIDDNPNLEKNQQGMTPEQNYGVSHDSLSLLDNNSPDHRIMMVTLAWKI
jgi:hypothetical protein